MSLHIHPAPRINIKMVCTCNSTGSKSEVVKIKVLYSSCHVIFTRNISFSNVLLVMSNCNVCNVQYLFWFLNCHWLLHCNLIFWYWIQSIFCKVSMNVTRLVLDKHIQTSGKAFEFKTQWAWNTLTTCACFDILSICLG